MIHQVPHQKRPPVQIERELGDLVIIEGVAYPGDLFRSIADAGPGCRIILRREGERVVLEDFGENHKPQP